MLTPTENQQLVHLLKKLAHTQPWDYEVFRRIVMAVPTIAVETIILRKQNGKPRVHLVERDANDPDFGGQLHFTGTILRNTDSCEKDALQRIAQQELGTTFSMVKFISPPMVIKTPRGTISEHIYVCTVSPESQPTVGSFYDAHNLPDTFIEHQREPLHEALAFFYNHQHLFTAD